MAMVLDADVLRSGARVRGAPATKWVPGKNVGGAIGRGSGQGASAIRREPGSS